MKAGILGGSFDPVHLGHISLAEDAIIQANLDEVVMIPAGIQPFKQDRKTASSEDRFRMLALAAGRNDKITVSRYELNNSGVSYTYITLRAMQEHYNAIARRRGETEAQLYFISGADSFIKIDSWMNAEELLKNYSYIIGHRPGCRDDELLSAVDRVKRKYGTEVILIRNRQMDISSTDIRRQLAGGHNTDHLLPPEVARYIQEKGLYV